MGSMRFKNQLCVEIVGLYWKRCKWADWKKPSNAGCAGSNRRSPGSEDFFFFTSSALGNELLKQKLTMVGTVRKKRPELPPALLTTRGFSSPFVFTEKHTLISYWPKKRKNVLVMSPRHSNAGVSDREDKKPTIILDYNKAKGGVDILDQVFYFICWYFLYLFIHLFINNFHSVSNSTTSELWCYFYNQRK